MDSLDLVTVPHVMPNCNALNMAPVEFEPVSLLTPNCVSTNATSIDSELPLSLSSANCSSPVHGNSALDSDFCSRGLDSSQLYTNTANDRTKNTKDLNDCIVKLRKAASARRSRDYRLRKNAEKRCRMEFLHMKLNMLHKLSTRKKNKCKFTAEKVRQIFVLGCVHSGMSRSSLASSLSSVTFKVLKAKELHKLVMT